MKKLAIRPRTLLHGTWTHPSRQASWFAVEDQCLTGHSIRLRVVGGIAVSQKQGYMKPSEMHLYTLVLIPIAALATEVPPSIDEDTTWSGADSPYSVFANTTIAANASLTIEAGVEVQLADETSIYVKGEIIARGTANNPILFTKANENGRWGSIIFEDTSIDATFTNLDDYESGSILDYCTLEFGSRAVQIDGASPFITNSTFTNNRFEPELTAAGAALFVTNGSLSRIFGNTFQDNVVTSSGHGGAIYVESANPILQDNTFIGNISAYGGAVTTVKMWSPIVGNTFEQNASGWEGGAISLLSSSPAFLNNIVTNNSTVADGGGVHVCVTCYPHAFPLVMDNTITHNTNTLHGAAGIGAAYLRVLSYNNIHDNLMGYLPADFAWHNEASVSWVKEPKLPHNWWGTTKMDLIDETIHDGHDDDIYGKVSVTPIATDDFVEPQTRVTITTMKYHYQAEDEPMPVFLTLYNPGPEREVQLHLLLSYGDDPPAFYRGELDFPGMERHNDAYWLTLPQNSAYFTTLIESPYRTNDSAFEYGQWHAAIFDDQGDPIGDTCSSRFELGEQR